MNGMTSRLLHFASAGLLAAMTLQAGPVDDFLAEAENFSGVLRQANEALSGIHDTASADAAVGAIESMQRARAAMAARCKQLRKQGWSVSRLHEEADLGKTLRNMPSGIYNELAERELDAGCHGSTQLYIALTGRQKEFTEAQAAAPVDAQDKATLAAMSHGFELIRLMTASNPGIASWQALPQLREDIATVEAGMARLRQSPAAMAEWHRMAVAARQPLKAFFYCFLNSSGEWQDMMFFKGKNILTSFYKPEAETILRERLRLAEYWWNYPKIKELALKTWQDITPAIEEYRKTHDLGDGDGHRRETAFSLPAGVRLEDSYHFLDDFAHAIAGDQAIKKWHFFDVDKESGLWCTVVPIFMGRAGDKAFQGDSNLLLPIYFRERKNP